MVLYDIVNNSKDFIIYNGQKESYVEKEKRAFNSFGKK